MIRSRSDCTRPRGCRHHRSGASPVETDDWGLDFVFTGSQKALALPPGLAGSASHLNGCFGAQPVGTGAGTIDLLKYDQAARTDRPTQDSIALSVYALERQLSRIDAEGGVESRLEPTRAMLAVMERWAAEARRI
jgi:aspartate aminotransferase-like enzyme